MRDSSSIFHAYVMHVHLKLRPHAGVETTMREIYLKMFVLGNPRRIVSRVRKDCTRCRRIHLKTVELKHITIGVLLADKGSGSGSDIFPDLDAGDPKNRIRPDPDSLHCWLKYTTLLYTNRSTELKKSLISA